MLKKEPASTNHRGLVLGTGLSLPGGEMAPGPDCAPVAGVDGFDGVGAADEPPDFEVVEPVAEWRVPARAVTRGLLVGGAADAQGVPEAGAPAGCRVDLPGVVSGAARFSSLRAASRPLRENLLRIVLRVPMRGSTVAPRRLYAADPSGVRRRRAITFRAFSAGGGPDAGDRTASACCSRPLTRAMIRSGPGAFRFLIAAIAGIGQPARS